MKEVRIKEIIEAYIESIKEDKQINEKEEKEKIKIKIFERK